MYNPRMFDGLTGCLIALVVLAVVGFSALAALVWWAVSNVNIVWGGA